MKKIILLVLVLCLTGCTVNYELKIDTDSIVEKIRLIVPNNEDYQTIIDQSYKTKQIAFTNNDVKNYYDVNKGEENNNLYLEYEYKYQNNDLEKSSAIGQCYSDFNVQNLNEQIIIDAKGTFNCLYRDGGQFIDEVQIRIETDLNVIDNNADKIDKNTYIWNINEENYKDKPIYLKIDKISKADFDSKLIFLAVVIGLAILVTIIILLVRARQSRINKF